MNFKHMKLLLYAYNIKILSIEFDNFDFTISYPDFYSKYWSTIGSSIHEFLKANRYISVEFTLRILDNKKRICNISERFYRNSLVTSRILAGSHTKILEHKLKSVSKLGT